MDCSKPSPRLADAGRLGINSKTNLKVLVEVCQQTSVTVYSVVLNDIEAGRRIARQSLT